MNHEKEVFHIAGDMDRGVSSIISPRDTTLFRPVLVYRGRYSLPLPELLVEADVYPTGDGDGVMVNTLCVRCKQSQQISSEQKEIRIDKEKGLLWIEPFGCKWELEEWRGSGLCGARVAYDGNVIKDA